MNVRNWILFSLIIPFGVFAQDTTVVSPDLLLVRLSERVYLHTSYTEIPKWGRIPSNGMILVDADSAFLFDTPMQESLTDQLLQFLEDSMRLQIRGFIPNHWHNDCTAGLEQLKSHSIPTWAHIMTNETLQEKGYPSADNGFEHSRYIPFGAGGIVAWYPGEAHALDNIVIWLPKEKVLFGGCMVRSLGATNMGNEADGNLIEWPHTINRLIQAFPEVQTVIPGHGAYGDTALLHHTIALARARHAELLPEWAQHYRLHQDLASLNNVVGALTWGTDSKTVQDLLGPGIDMGFELRYLAKDSPSPSQSDYLCPSGAIFRYDENGLVNQIWIGEICE